VEKVCKKGSGTAGTARSVKEKNWKINRKKVTGDDLSIEEKTTLEAMVAFWDLTKII